jgi:prevent-host-death family protein
VAPRTIGLTEAKAKLSQITAEVNRTGRSVLVIKNNHPWVTIAPATDIAPKMPKHSAFGCLRQHADPSRRTQEDGAWEAAAAAADKHAIR